MYYSIRFSTENDWLDKSKYGSTSAYKQTNRETWEDWHLVPTSRPVFNPPKTKTNYIEIPGSNSQLDLTEVVSGEPVYENREGSLEFLVMNGYESWIAIYTKIMKFLHGKTLKCCLEDDPGYYYQGRFFVNEWKSDPHYSLITIDYIVDPYKYEVTNTNSDWLWDPFSFETGVIKNYKGVLNEYTTGTKQHDFYVIGTDKKVTPIFHVNQMPDSGASIYATLDGVTYGGYPLNKGDNSFPTLYTYSTRNDKGKATMFSVQTIGSGTINLDVLIRGAIL